MVVRQALMDQCFGPPDRYAAEPASSNCGGSAVEITGDTLQRLSVPFAGSATGVGAAASQDNACCAACRKEPKCEFWVRNAHGACWLKRDAVTTTASAHRRSGVLRRSGRSDPLSRLSRAHGVAFAASPLAAHGHDVDPRGWCGKGCGAACWRGRFVEELWASRQRYA
jgi:hypothetical protein